MNKKVFMSAIAAVVVVATSGISFAHDALPQEKKFIPKNTVNKSVDGFRHTKIKHHQTKSEMEAKKAEFEKRLNLTEKQKIQIEKNKQKDKEKMKPIFDEMKAKRAEIMSIHKNSKLTDSEKVKKVAELEKDIIDLRVKADELRRANMKNFESVLTKEQLVEFEKIKEEQKLEMEKRFKHFQGQKRIKGPKPPIGLPVEPKPIPEIK